MNIRITSSLLLAALLLAGQAVAETRYISDQIYVPMRAGPGNEFRILHRGLRTGTSMTLLQEDAGNGFSKVRVGDQEGFIRAQYLTGEAPALVVLPGVQEQAAKARAENRELRSQLGKRDTELASLNKSLKETKSQLASKTEEMLRLEEVTADPLAIDRRNKELMEENLQLKNEVQVLETENSQLVQDNSIRWYLYGGGTILLGILLGLFLPMIRVQKKQSDWV